MLSAVAVLLVVCGALGRAFSDAPTSQRTSQAQTVDPAANVWVFLIDDLHLDFTATGRLRDLFKKVTAGLVREGDLFAVVSSGPSSIAIDLTRDDGQFAHVPGRITGMALQPSDILQAEVQREVRFRAHVTLNTAYDVMKRLALLPNKRKACIYISNGYYLDLTPGTGSQAGYENPFLGGGIDVSLERLRAEVGELARQATRASVTIFAIDPRGLSGPPTIEPNVNDAAWQQYWTRTGNSLRVISEQTGGRLIQEDLDGNLKRIIETMR